MAATGRTAQKSVPTRGHRVDDLEVVVFGAGKLGPGLIGPPTAEAGLRLSLVIRKNRPSGRSAMPNLQGLINKREFEVQSCDGTVSVPVANVYYSDDEVSRHKLTEYLVSTASVLLCTTARQGQLDAVALARDVVEKRQGHGLFGFMPAENDVFAATASFGATTLHRKGCAYLPTMVDRICPAIEPGRGIPRVIVEPESEWVARRPSFPKRPSQLQAAFCRDLERLGIVLIDEAGLAEAQLRKRLLMNGVQMASAALAYKASHKNLGSFLATPNGEAALRGLMQEYGLHLSMELPGLRTQVLTAYEAWYAKRILRSADDVARLLIVSSTSTSTYLRAMAVRIGETHDALATIYSPKELRDTYVHEAYIAASDLLASEIRGR